MKRAALVILVLLSVTFGAAAAVVGALWIFPGGLVSVAARALAPHGIYLSAARVRGAPGAGWLFEGLKFRADGVEATVKKLRIDIDWASTFTGRPALDALWADGLRVRVRTHSSPPPEPPGPKKSGPPVLFPIHSLRLSDGAFSLESPGKDSFRVTGIAVDARLTQRRADVRALAATVMGNSIEARGHYEPDGRSGAVEARVPGTLKAPGVPPGVVGPVWLAASIAGDDVTVQRLDAVVETSTVAAEGRVHLSPLTAQAHIESRGPLAIRADVRGDGNRWEARAVGVQKASRLTALFSYGLKAQDWSVTLSAAGIPATLVPEMPPSLGALSMDVSAQGHGIQPRDIEGRGKISFAATNGPHLKGDVALERGSARTTVAISSGGIDGQVAGAWRLGEASGEGVADLTLSPSLHTWLPVSAEGPVHLDLKGPQKRLAWNLRAQLKKVSINDVDIDQLGLNGQGRSLAPPEGRLAVDVAGLTAGRQKVEKAALVVDGSLARHRFDLKLAREGASLAASGTGDWADGRWSSQWTRLDAQLDQPWRLTGPFALAVGGASGVDVRGFRLVSANGGALSVDGGLVAGDIRDARLSARGLDLDGLRKLAGLDTVIAGAASLDLSASGPITGPVARLSGRLSGLSIDRRPAGDVDAAATVSGGRAVVDHVRLISKGGTLTVSGDVPLSWSGRKTPAFQIKVQTAGLDPSALPVPLGEWTIEGGKLTSDLTVTGRGRRFSASGPLDFTASKIFFGDKKTGSELKDVRVRLIGDGDALRVAEASMKGGGGTASVAGSVATTGADLSLSAHEFEYRHPSGVSAKFNSTLSLRGPWDGPHLTGRVDILKGDIQPVKEKKDKKESARKKKDEEPAKPSAPPSATPSSPLAAQIAIAFPNNVWYRDGQTSIELKGDLDVRKDAGAPWLVFGTVETLRGDYFFYGRAFSIQQGRVTFTGEEPPNPRLELTAVNQNQANNVAITITGSGTLRDPRIALSSQPPMEETDIIAVLVTGSPMGAEHQSAGGEDMARSMAANYLAEKVRQQVQNKVRLDVLQLHLGEGGQKGDVTIGNRVSKNLFLSYGQTLEADAERRVNAEYVLTPRFSLQGQTTNIGRYVLDLLFRFGFY